MDQAIARWHRGMPHRLRNVLVSKLKALVYQGHGAAALTAGKAHDEDDNDYDDTPGSCPAKLILTVGTLFSGTDVCAKVLQSLASFWEHEYHVKIKFEMLFQCELDWDKQQFLQAEFPECPILFEDASQIREPRVWNLKTKQYVRLPSVDILLGGPSCKSRSPLNPDAASHKRVCQEQDRFDRGNFRLELRVHWFQTATADHSGERD